MAKKGSVKYICQNCGAAHSSWMGRCSACGEWNTITEQLDSVALAAPGGRKIEAAQVSKITKIKPASRIHAGVDTVDEVLGGGFVPGSVTLLAGQPGIGKSTILIACHCDAPRSIAASSYSLPMANSRPRTTMTT